MLLFADAKQRHWHLRRMMKIVFSRLKQWILQLVSSGRLELDRDFETLNYILQLVCDYQKTNTKIFRRTIKAKMFPLVR